MRYMVGGAGSMGHGIISEREKDNLVSVVHHLRQHTEQEDYTLSEATLEAFEIVLTGIHDLLGRWERVTVMASDARLYLYNASGQSNEWFQFTFDRVGDVRVRFGEYGGEREFNETYDVLVSFPFESIRKMLQGM